MKRKTKIVTIIGARPQFIKAAAVSKAINDVESLDEIIVHTGQHFDENMSDIFFEQMQIPKPNYNLNIHSLPHGAMTGRMLEQTESILLSEKPDYVLVYGDTDSTLAGALAAKKLHIKLAHVEAGLRSYNMNMPEEINRILTDRVSDILFCPSDTAVKNLQSEAYSKKEYKIVKTGDVMNDAAILFSDKEQRPAINTKTDNFILATIHRPVNTDNPENLKNIFQALNKISRESPIILPLHPRTKKKVKKYGIELNSRVSIIEPVGYLEMLYLLKRTKLVMTDSGGLQKEAYFYKKYCITLRNETEWTELTELGYNFLSGSNSQKIFELYKRLSIKKPAFIANLYGNGKASEKIAEVLKSEKN